MTLAQSEPCAGGKSLPFRSILFDEPEIGADTDRQAQPNFFADLNLDQIIASMTAGRDEYNLQPFFHIPLTRLQTINYRHDILRDLESPALFKCVQVFAEEMRTMRSHLDRAGKLYFKYQKETWFLYAVEVYGRAVSRLASDLTLTDLCSSGFMALRDYLAAYASSQDFLALIAETQKLKTDLSGISYSLHLEDNRIEVGRCGVEPDYSADVLQTFEKFKQGATKGFRFRFADGPEMNHIEAAILDRVALLHPEMFSSLDDYRGRHDAYLDNTIARFDREVQFYVACLERIKPFKQAGLSFCYPTVSETSKEVCGREVFDIALASNLIGEHIPVVANDFYLTGPERIFVVSGPNQGGKTTFARTFGQLHYLANIGCPVPGKEAKLFHFDKLFTHFESEEDIQNLSGKLEHDLLRIHQILEQATSNSIVIMNESFLSTTVNDALILSKEVMQRIIQRDILCVSVTFLDELASLSPATVSMVSTVNPEDPALRTFKLVRKPADGLAYAVAIAEKYRLTYENVKERVATNVKEGVAS
jgi:DNA mismatch repair protein MutS